MIAAAGLDYPDVLLHLFVDLVAIALLAWALYLRRHGRRDLLLAFVAFNVGLFAVVSVISTRHISVGLGFGLFAILSIIRLRSEPFDNVELAYFFLSLVLGLVNGLRKIDLPLLLALDAVLLLTLYFVDHPAFHTTVRRRRITLDAIETDADGLRRSLTERLGIEIVDLAITEIDYVRETTRVVLRYVADPRTPSETDAAETE